MMTRSWIVTCDREACGRNMTIVGETIEQVIERSRGEHWYMGGPGNDYCPQHLSSVALGEED